jgi:membrane protease YdiL (CAAX protease family)
MVSNLWKYGVILGGAVVLSGIDPAWLNLTGIEPAVVVFGGLALGLVVYPVGECTARVTRAFGYEYATDLRSAIAPDTIRGWVGFVTVSLVVVSAWEELLFRGVLVGVTAATLGISPWVTGIVAVLAFGAIHQYAPANVVVATVMGAVLTIAFVLGASLPLLVVAHTTANAIEFVVYETSISHALPTGQLGFAE